MRKILSLILIFSLIINLNSIYGGVKEEVASTVITNIDSGFADAQITSLSLQYNTGNYMTVGVALESCASGQSYQPSNTLGTDTPPSSGTNYYSDVFLISHSSPGASITVYGWARTLNGLYYPAGSASFITPPVAPSFSKSVGITSVTIRPNGQVLDPNVPLYDYVSEGDWTSIVFKLWNSSQTVLLQSSTVTDLSQVYFGGLTQGTSYVITGQATYSGKTGNISSSSFTTLVPIRPSNWSWARAYTQGSSIGIVIDGEVSPITASNWNSFISKIQDFRTYKNLTNYWPSWYPVSSGNIFYLDYIVDAVALISEMNPPTSTPSTSSNLVTAYMFNRLRDSLNSIP